MSTVIESQPSQEEINPSVPIVNRPLTQIPKTQMTDVMANHGVQLTTIDRFYSKAASFDRFGMGVLRLGLIVVLCWIGGLKAADYEAEGIVPFVANSPLMSFFYHHPTPEYREPNPAGGLNIANHQWNETNGTYIFSYGLGIVIVGLGLLIALHPWRPQIAAAGSFLVIVMAFTTLSFLVTTPEAWVSGAGGSVHGFPFLALPGLLVVKDSIMLGAAIVTMADSARSYLRRKANPGRIEAN